MKRFTRPLVLLFLLFACTAATLQAALPKVGILLKDRAAFWLAAEKAILAAAAKEPDFQFIIKAPPVTYSLHQQRLMLHALMKEDLAVLIIAPLDGNLFETEIAALKEKGTKIVALDTNFTAIRADVFVGHNQEAMAREAGQVFAKLVGEGNSGGVLRPNVVGGMTLRERLFLSSFRAAAPSATLHLDVYASDDDESQFHLILEKHPDMRAVATLFTGTTQVMSRVIQEKGVAGKIKHLGFGAGLPPDVVKAIASDAMHVWIAQLPTMIGRQSVEIAVGLAQGKTFPAKLDVPYVIVTKENLESPEVKAHLD
ncbi:MAG TPA: substrate-binding domain-containing protein [Opitutaceae bacterium]|nr:substrate-binding domain-containing protein [Opitutaceae bacterium]